MKSVSAALVKLICFATAWNTWSRRSAIGSDSGINACAILRAAIQS
jgi:hypothetical protein